MSPFGNLLRRLTWRERRGVKRKSPAALVAYYWDGATPVAHVVRNVSASGLYLVTEQRWYPKTMIKMTLRRNDLPDNAAGNSIEMIVGVVRGDTDGVGLRFVLEHGYESDPSRRTSRATLKRFLQALDESGETDAVEYIAPLSAPGTSEGSIVEQPLQQLEKKP
jgi:PilZ domain